MEENMTQCPVGRLEVKRIVPDMYEWLENQTTHPPIKGVIDMILESNNEYGPIVCEKWPATFRTLHEAVMGYLTKTFGNKSFLSGLTVQDVVIFLVVYHIQQTRCKALDYGFGRE